MIEKMKLVSVIAMESEKDALLQELQKLELLHIAEKRAGDGLLSERLLKLTKIQSYLLEYQSSPKEELLSDTEFEELLSRVASAIEEKKELLSLRSASKMEIEKLQAWGDFSPEQVRELRDLGYDLHFYRCGKKDFKLLLSDPSLRLIKLASVEKSETFASLGPLPAGSPAMEFPLPEKSLSDLEETLRDCEERLSRCEALFAEAAQDLPSFRERILQAEDSLSYSSVSNSAEKDSGLVWLTGYIPEADMDRFIACAREKSWAYRIDDVEEGDELVPTKVRYNRLTRLLIPVFDILGTVPGYREYDISFWFLCFFTLFFAMIIGDAGYGLLFLIGTAVIHIRRKKANDAITLLYVLSAATVIWGSLTGTWFGFEGAMRIPFLKALVIPKFANYPEYFGVSTGTQQNAIMKFCFIIGTVQLSLACVMNIRKKLPLKDWSLFADLGWLAAIDALYFLVLYLVIGEKVQLLPVALVVGMGFLLVVLFGGMSPDKSFGQGLKAGLGDAFTVFLNTISAFGNVMSYIRLFAVGMASLAIAQSFNNMASGFSGPAVIVGVVIVLIGHALNIVMGVLSVAVHGIRLNLLEFSGQLGMEWSGTAYDPFRKKK